jgi:hypothetical protein
MGKQRHPTVVRRSRDSRLDQLGSVGPFTSASLVVINVRCGRKGCHCATGEGHPSNYLSFSQGGKTVMRYVPKDRVEEVRKWVREHKRLKRLTREISDLTLELLAAEAHVLREQRRRQRRR